MLKTIKKVEEEIFYASHDKLSEILKEWGYKIIEECSKEAAFLSSEEIVGKNIRFLIEKNIKNKIL